MTIISIALYVLTALLLAFGIFKGIKRGIIGESLRLAVNLISAAIALLVSSGLIGAISRAFGDTDLAATLTGYGITLDEKVSGVVSSISASTVSSIVSLPVALIVIPILTIIIYIIAKSLLSIPLKILAKIIPDGLLDAFGGKLKLPLNKILGALIGVIAAILTLAIIVFPFAIASDIATDVSEVLSASENEEDKSAAELVSRYSEPISKNAAVSVCSSIFGGIYEGVTSVKTEEGRMPLNAVVHDGALIYVEMDALDGVKLNSMTDAELESVISIIDIATANKFYSPIIADLISAVASSATPDTLGLDPDGYLGDFANGLISIFANTTTSTVGEDLTTVVKVIVKITSSGALDGDFTPEKLLGEDAEGKTLVSYVLDILNANPRFASLCSTLSNAAMQLVIDNSGIESAGIDTSAVVGDMKDAISDVSSISREDYATDEEYESAVADEVKEALAKNGINVDETIAPEDKERFDSAVAEIAISAANSGEEITDAKMLEMMASYYEKYMSETSSPSDSN